MLPCQSTRPNEFQRVSRSFVEVLKVLEVYKHGPKYLLTMDQKDILTVMFFKPLLTIPYFRSIIPTLSYVFPHIV